MAASWDLESSGVMCSKEDVHDYCYFLDFDLLLFEISVDVFGAIVQSMLELFYVKCNCFVVVFGLMFYDASLLMVLCELV